jgi:hypothetical protein
VRGGDRNRRPPGGRYDRRWRRRTRDRPWAST